MTSEGTSQALQGRRIVITRPRERARRLAERLRSLGAEPIVFPTVRIEPADPGPLDAAVRSLERYDWIVFTSANGVEAFWTRLVAAEKDARDLVRRKVAAIGPVTAQALRQRGVEPVLVPDEYVAEAILGSLGDVRGLRFLLPRADIAREALAAGLRERGAAVTEVVAYRTVGAGAAPGSLPRRRGHVHQLVHGAALRRLRRGGGSGEGGVHRPCHRRHGEGARPDGARGRDGLHRRRPDPGPRRSIERMTSFPVMRLRRLRRTPALRALVRETSLAASDFIYPLFVTAEKSKRKEIASMPGVAQLSVDGVLQKEIEDVVAHGIRAVLLFGIPASKDSQATQSYAASAPVQRAVALIKKAAPDLVVMTDVCLCEYTDHGHCGLIRNGAVDNDSTLDVLGKVVASHAAAGADVVAPSGMMDGMVGAIRRALDGAGFADTAILSYAVKYASSFYGPFRDAAESPPSFGDRKSHQMDSGNVREALRECALDVQEGADALMVKPGLPYLDVLHAVREAFDLPLASYNVSGEYAMIEAAARNGWIDERPAVLEVLRAFRRAGADLILTYHAKEAAGWLRDTPADA